MADKVFYVGPWERVLHLRTAPAMEGLESSDLVRIAEFAKERRYAKGAYLLGTEPGAPAFHLLVEGRVRVKRPGRPSHSIEPGEVVGFLNLLAGRDKGVEARAETDSLTLEFNADAHLDLCEERFPILLNYARYLSRSLIREKLANPLAINSLGPVDSTPPPEGPDLVTRVLVLNRSPLFRNCSLDGLGELSRHLVVETHPEGETLWRVGEKHSWFALIERGAALSSLETTRIELGPYAIVGMEEALAGEPRWHDLRAKGSLTSLRVEMEPFLDILEDHFGMATALLSSMADQLLELLGGGAGSGERGSMALAGD